MTVAELVQLMDEFDDNALVLAEGQNRFWDLLRVKIGTGGSCIIEIA